MLYPVNQMTVAQITRAVSGRLLFGDENFAVDSISTDSRTVEKSTLYIPVKGERFDGHDFIGSVCEVAGCGYLCSNGALNSGAAFAIEVENTRKALLDLASFYRDKFSVKLIGLTGSVGKTTTKEFLASVVSQKYNTLSTKGNFNNDIGVPYTLFGLNGNTEAAVIEMGMSNFGEIEVLSLCAKPDIAVITNIGTSHIEFLKSREGILRAKSEIFKGLKPGGKAVLNGDDPYLWSLRDKLDIDVTYVGFENNECDFVAKNIVCSEHGCEFECDGKKFRINLAGIHNIYNALIAIAVGGMLSLDYNQIATGLESYHTDGIRQNIIAVNGYKVINDCYNASPQSVVAELGVLACVEAKRRIAVLGDMAELGEMAQKLHYDVGSEAAKKADVLVCAGELSSHIIEGAGEMESYHFKTADEAAEFLKGFIRPGDAVLVKASRCMKFEKISEKLI